jgi:hypothetical protein
MHNNVFRQPLPFKKNGTTTHNGKLEKREVKQEERGKNSGGLKKKAGGLLRPLSKTVLHMDAGT